MAKLHDAATTGDVQAVESLLAGGADVNAKRWYIGNTPVQLAAENGHANIVALLLDAGAKDDPADILFLAIEKKQKSVVELALARGISQAHLELALGVALAQSQLDVAVLLIAQGANVNKMGLTNITALMLAAVDKNVEIVRQLLDKGADVNARTPEGGTALQFAFFEDGKEARRDLVELLLAKGANINAATDSGTTPLWAAYTVNRRDLRLELMKLLLDRGADTNARRQDKSLLETVESEEGDDQELVALLRARTVSAGAEKS